jgi:maltose O-acetyltransferase
MSRERDLMLAGELYDPLDPELVQARARARDLCQDLNATRESNDDERRRIVTELFGAGGDDVWVQPPFYCDYGTNITLGRKVFFGRCMGPDVVRIGDFTLFDTRRSATIRSMPRPPDARRPVQGRTSG